jgi:hypothetical protein
MLKVEEPNPVAYSFIQLRVIEHRPLTCDGCSQDIPVGGFYLNASKVVICVDCSKQLSKISRRMTPEQMEASRPVWFADQRRYVAVLRVRHDLVKGIYEVKTIDCGHWYKTDVEFYTYLIKVRNYQRRDDESSQTFETFGPKGQN